MSDLAATPVDAAATAEPAPVVTAGPVADALAPLPTPPALSCTRVSAGYGRREVIAGVDLTVASGEWTALIGPNGAGKSTLLRCIAGVLAHRGDIVVGDGRRPGPGEVAMVPQSPVLPVGMTVGEYVLLGRTAHLRWLERESARDRMIVDSVLRRLGLLGFADRMVTELSGGEAQRTVIARALAQQAPVMLLDEPTSALDLGHQVAVLELVDDLRRSENLTVVAAMHDLTTAARFADRLVLIDAGTIVASGPVETVLDAELLSKVYATPLTVRRIDGELVVLPGRRS
ncbi:MAG: ABC transporter ATP-binding protein [Acidimicrobiales bacterium]